MSFAYSGSSPTSQGVSAATDAYVPGKKAECLTPSVGSQRPTFHALSYYIYYVPVANYETIGVLKVTKKYVQPLLSSFFRSGLCPRGLCLQHDTYRLTAASRGTPRDKPGPQVPYRNPRSRSKRRRSKGWRQGEGSPTEAPRHLFVCFCPTRLLLLFLLDVATDASL